MNKISYSTVSNVIEMWEQARRHPAFEEEIGSRALERLFQLSPSTRRCFGMEEEKGCVDPRSNATWKQHGGALAQMFDTAMSLLGPDMETMCEVLEDLGKRHISYKVQPEYFSLLGKVMVDALARLLGPDWTRERQESWSQVYTLLANEIIKSMVKHTRIHA